MKFPRRIIHWKYHHIGETVRSFRQIRKTDFQNPFILTQMTKNNVQHNCRNHFVFGIWVKYENNEDGLKSSPKMKRTPINTTNDEPARNMLVIFQNNFTKMQVRWKSFEHRRLMVHVYRVWPLFCKRQEYLFATNLYSFTVIQITYLAGYSSPVRWFTTRSNACAEF